MRLKSIARMIGLSMAAGAVTEAIFGETARAKSAEDSNRNLVASGFAAWADGSGSPYGLLADHVRWTITGNSLAARTYPNRKAFIEEVIQPFNARMRDRLVPTLHRLYADGDTVIAHFDAAGVASDGEPYENSYAWILRMKNGQIVEAFAYFDAIAFDELWRRVEPD